MFRRKDKDLHNIWPHRHITSKARLDASPIHGKGLFAIQNISKGDIILVYGGVVVPREELIKNRQLFGHCGIQIDDDFFMCPTSRKEIEKSGTFNHSCDPNVGFKNQIEVMAIKDIACGEELKLDYAFCESYFPSFLCNCQSVDCRHHITQDDWKLPEVCEKYGQYFSPYLKAKF